MDASGSKATPSTAGQVPAEGNLNDNEGGRRIFNDYLKQQFDEQVNLLYTQHCSLELNKRWGSGNISIAYFFSPRLSLAS